MTGRRRAQVPRGVQLRALFLAVSDSSSPNTPRPPLLTSPPPRCLCAQTNAFAHPESARALLQPQVMRTRPRLVGPPTRPSPVLAGRAAPLPRTIRTRGAPPPD